MARLTTTFKGIALFMDEEVIFTLKSPTNEQANVLKGAIADVFGMDISSKERAAKIEDLKAQLFDQLLVSVDSELLDTDEKPVTAERRDKIPADWKAGIIDKRLEVRVRTKN